MLGVKFVRIGITSGAWNSYFFYGIIEPCIEGLGKAFNKEPIDDPEDLWIWPPMLKLWTIGRLNSDPISPLRKASIVVYPLTWFLDGVPFGVFLVEFCLEATLELTAEDLLELNW